MTGEREGLADLSLVLRRAAREYLGLEERGYWDSGIADAQARALADLLAARDRRVRAEAVREAAEDLPARTEGTDRVATETWRPNDRDIYSLAIEEAQAALRDRADRIEAQG